MIRGFLAALLATAVSAGMSATAFAQSAPVLDGSGFGLPSSTVLYDPAAPTSNFGSPGPTTSGAAYNIYSRADATYAYFLLQQNGVGTSAGAFANLYFGTGSSAFGGSDLGFEVTNSDVFYPSTGATQSTVGTGITSATLNGGTSIEFAIPFSYLETDPQNVGFDKLTVTNPNLVLRLSQTFGYSVAGGATYGTNRLGTVAASFAAATPEPATWLMLIVGFGVIGFALRRRQEVAIRVAYAA